MYQATDGDYFYALILAASDEEAWTIAVKNFRDDRISDQTDDEERELLDADVKENLMLWRLPNVCMLSYKRQGIDSEYEDITDQVKK